MLGAARASQYAGWWTAGNISATANLTSVSSLAYKRKITPSYSYLVEVDSSSTNVGYNLGYIYNNDSYVDLTGLTGFTGYNNLNMTMFQHFYLPWTGKTSASTNGQFRFDLRQTSQSGIDKSVTIYCGQNNGSGKFYVTVDAVNVSGTFETTDSYTNYNDRWLTVVFSASNTTSNFTNWSASGTGSMYCRIALYDTEAGTLIGKSDFFGSGPGWDLSTLPTSLTTNPDNQDFFRLQGYPGGTYANDYDYRVQNAWISVGTMFDPLTTTDTTWLTSNPNKQIGNAVAWVNSQFNDYVEKETGNPTLQQGVKKIANTDLFVNSQSAGNLYNILFQSANSNVFLTQYSNTVVLMNGGT